MIKLYDMPGNSNARKIRALARELDVTLEYVTVDLLKGEGKNPDFLAINPNGKIPAMTDGAFKLFESNAILTYLATKFKSPLLPTDPQGRAQVDQWLFWQTAHLGSAVGKIIWERFYKQLMNLGSTDETRVQEGLTDLERFLAVLDGFLARQKYVCGSNMTIADYALCGTLAKTQRERSGIEAEVMKFTHIKRWLGEIENRPAWIHAEK